MMKDCSPLLLELGPNDPGILVTQSVHKQQAGFHKHPKFIKRQSYKGTRTLWIINVLITLYDACIYISIFIHYLHRLM